MKLQKFNKFSGFFNNWNINKTLIVIAISLGIIAIVAITIFASISSKQDKINYEDKIIAKNLFEEITLDFNTKETNRDGIKGTFEDEFAVDETQEALIFSSQEEFKNFFLDTTYEIKIEDRVVHITNKYQTKKILLEAEELRGKFNNAEKVEELGENIYLLTFDSQKRTKEAYEYLQNIDWIKKIELDEVIKIKTIPDQSQTLYENGNKNEDSENKVFGIKAMGLDNFKTIIEENGNPSPVVVSTIGYGAAIDNTYFGGRISEDKYNAFKDNQDINQTIEQGSRILEVIQESTTHNVKILPIVTVNSENYTTISTIIKAINYAVEKSDVIDYELIHRQDYMIDIVLKKAFQENVPICVVTSSEFSEQYPADNSTTIAVSSIDKNEKITNFSGSGEFVDFASFSTDIEEIFNTSSTVSKWSGAQYSNAEVVSAIALIKTYHKNYTILEIYNMLRNYSKDLGKEGRDEQYGYGCPNFSGLKISDLDKTNPELADIVVDNEKWEKTKTVTIKGTDEIRVLGWAVTKTNEKPKEWTKLPTLSTKLETAYTIDDNGKYYVWISDSAGNIAQKEIEINKIDKIVPSIDFTVDTSKLSTEKFVQINITAKDEEAGLNESPYSWDGMAWGKENSFLKVTQNGTYTIYVKDALENIAKKEITINNFTPEVTPTPTEGDNGNRQYIIDEGHLIKTINISNNWNENINSEVKITFRDNLDIVDWRITETSETPRDFRPNNEPTNDASEDDHVNIVDPNNSVNGYSNLTITVSLTANRQYYVWVKFSNGNVDLQPFRIVK